MQLSAGKWQRLRSLTDEQGRFKMMAIDQRDSMREAIRKKLGDIPSGEMFRHVARVKELVTKHLARFSTATLTDPVYGYPYSIQHFPRALVYCWLTKSHHHSGWRSMASANGEQL